MTERENSTLPPLRMLNQNERWELYKKMRGMLVRKYDYPVRYAFKIGLIMFGLLIMLPHRPESLFVAILGAMAIGLLSPR